MVICAALLVLPLATVDVDSEQAVRIAEAFAKRIQIFQKLELTDVVFKAWPNETQQWHISFKYAQSKGGVYIHVDKSGHVRYLSADTERKPVMPTGVAQMPETVAHARILFSRVAENKNVDATPEIATGEHNVLAKFYVLKNGLRFYNVNPVYAYLIGFDPDGNEYRWFAPPPPFPPVASATPGIREGRAVEICKTAFGDELGKVADPEQVEDVRGGDNKLGYFLVPKETVARLVWVVELELVRNLGGRQVSVFWKKGYVDAHTGEVFRLKDDATTVEMLTTGVNRP